MKVTVSFLDALDAQVRSGSAPSLERFLEAETYEVPRQLTARYANLLRRMGGTKQALSLLNPIVRNNSSKPSLEETIEYASCLNRLGLCSESIDLLKTIANEPYPEIQFELAAAYIFQWGYRNAIPHLLKFVAAKNLSIYRLCVGELNLAAAYFYTDEKEKAKNVLQKALNNIQQNGYSLLYSNAQEMLGEIALDEREFNVAEKLFKEAAEKLASSNTRYQLYLRKWLVIIKVLKEKGSKESLIMLDDLRTKVVKIHDWNSLREIELYKAVATNDVGAIIRLYYGVPQSEYRNRILNVWGQPIAAREYYDRRIGPGPISEKKVFDVSNGRDLFSGAQLKKGQGPHRLLQTLVTDFYAPFATTKVFSQVFKGAFFNPSTSPGQVYQLVKRINDWFVKNSIPLVVLHGLSGYRLRAKEAYILRLPSNTMVQTKIDDFIRLLKENEFSGKFSVQMVVDKLGISRASANRLLKRGVDDGKLLRQGLARSTYYRLI